MAVLSTGQSFASGDQVTAQKLDDIIGQAFLPRRQIRLTIRLLL